MSTDALQPVAARLRFRQYMAELWARRDFIRTVPVNALRAQNARTFLGGIWLFANPALQVAVYFGVFGLLLRVDRGVDDYLAFLVIGVLTFQWVTNSLTRGAKSISSNESLIRSLYFPRAIMPITAAMTAARMFAYSLVVMITVSVLSGHPPSLRWFAAVPAAALTGTFLLGLVFIVARVGHRLPDLHSILPHAIRLIFYTSGALYDPRTRTTNQLVIKIFEFNPFFEILSAWRWALLGRPMPGWNWLVLAGWALLLLSVGFSYFWRAEISYGASR